MTKKVLLGRIVGCHGLRGNVRVLSFTHNPTDLFSYGQLQDEDSNILLLKAVRFFKNRLLVASIYRCDNRDQAKKFINKNIFIDRNQLPETTDDSIYFEDLKGLDVYDENVINYGKVFLIQDYGAGPFIEIKNKEGKIGTAFLHNQSIACIKDDRIVIHSPYIIF